MSKWDLYEMIIIWKSHNIVGYEDTTWNAKASLTQHLDMHTHTNTHPMQDKYDNSDTYKIWCIYLLSHKINKRLSFVPSFSVTLPRFRFIAMSSKFKIRGRERYQEKVHVMLNNEKRESGSKSCKGKDKQRRKGRTFNYLKSLLQIYMYHFFLNWSFSLCIFTNNSKHVRSWLLPYPFYFCFFVHGLKYDT